MRPLRRHILLYSFKIFDVSIMLLALGISIQSISLRGSGISWTKLMEARVEMRIISLFAVFGLVWFMIGQLSGLYRSRRLSHGKDEIPEVLRTSFFTCLLSWPLGLFMGVDSISATSVLLCWGLASSVLVLSRLALRYLLKEVRLWGRNLRHILIVGSNHRACRFVNEVAATPAWGYRVVGFVDDRVVSTELPQAIGDRVGSLEDLPALLRDRIIDEVAVFLPWKSFYEQIAGIAAMCQEQGIVLRLSSQVVDLQSIQSAERQASPTSIVIAQHLLWKEWQLWVKRALDVVLSFSLLILLAPLLALIAALIRVTSPGPIFFVQERVGINKRRFEMYQFRSMSPDAEARLAEIEEFNELDGPVFKMRHDPRLTPIGKWLRRTSLDELPQLINVLKGDMSLVGPRPLPLRDYRGFYQDSHRRRLSIRPGLTGLWQVRGRSSLPFERWMELDMKYIDEWSLSLDLRILLETIPAVLKGSGAK